MKVPLLLSLIFLFLLFLVSLPAPAETYLVNPDGSGDYPTIQAAINVSGNGYIILLGDGLFTGTVNRDLIVDGNAGGDWEGMEQYLGVDGNISLDPMFCDASGGNFYLSSASSCAPFSAPNDEYDLIGAWPVGCEETPVTPVTWGSLKSRFK